MGAFCNLRLRKIQISSRLVLGRSPYGKLTSPLSSAQLFFFLPFSKLNRKPFSLVADGGGGWVRQKTVMAKIYRGLLDAEWVTRTEGGQKEGNTPRRGGGKYSSLEFWINLTRCFRSRPGSAAPGREYPRCGWIEREVLPGMQIREDGSSAILEYFGGSYLQLKKNPPPILLPMPIISGVGSNIFLLVVGKYSLSRDFLQQSLFGECDQNTTTTHHNCVPEQEENKSQFRITSTRDLSPWLLFVLVNWELDRN